MDYLKNKNYKWKHVIVIPFITILIVPIVIFDIMAEIYHRLCFPLCGLKCLNRRDYIKIVDRGKLQYLNLLQKMYCMYCGYANGVINYWRVMAGMTEKYWCGIKHQQTPGFVTEEHQNNFATYGDREEFEKMYKS